MNEAIRQIQTGVWLACVTIATMIAIVHLFPSLRGPQWTGEEWQVALILAVLAVALKP